MKNYYEILEVSQNASSEIIEKAFRTLAKKYHPDLQDNRKKEEYEEKMKEVNEAYSVLSDDFKRNTYDKQLEKTTVPRHEYEKVLKENMMLREQLQNIVSRSQSNIQNDNTINNMSRVLREQINRATSQRAQESNYDRYVENTENIKFKHDLKYYLKLVAALIMIIFVLFLIYQIPVVNQFFTNLYEENIIFKAIVDIFKNTITTDF